MVQERIERALHRGRAARTFAMRIRLQSSAVQLWEMAKLRKQDSPNGRMNEEIAFLQSEAGHDQAANQGRPEEKR